MYTPQKRALGETLVQTPTGSPLGEFTPRRRSVLCQAASPVVSPGFGQGHRPTVGCFLASTPIARSKQAMISPQLSHHIPRAVSGGGGTMVKRLVSPSQSGVQQVKRSELTAHLQSPRPANSANLHPSRATCRNVQSPCSPRTSTCNGMCSEAYQLMQFCSHCNIGMDGRKSGERKRLQREMASPLHSQPLLLQREKSLSELNQATSRVSSRERVDSVDPKLAELLRENSHHHQQQVEEMQGSSYYPFLAPPTGHRNVSLSQLNTDSNYQLDPGPPKELTVTKCNPRARGDIVRHPTSFDSAVRPVVYDWNGWWEAEHVLCMMNEESFMNYIECRSESTIKDILEQKKQPRSNGAMPRAMSPERCQRRSCSHFGFRRGSGQNWVRRLKIRKPKTPSPPPPPPPREKAKKHKSTIGHHRDLPVGNMKLVVSIPFRQLITDRQMKKYGVSGAKYRIQTDQNVA